MTTQHPYYSRPLTAGRLIVACFALIVHTHALSATSTGPKMLVVYASGGFDPTGYDSMKHLADAVADGATSVGATVKVLEVEQANYKRDVFEWADCMALGSSVYNGNPAPSMLAFVNSFDFQDRLTNKVGGSFAMGGSESAGLEAVLDAMNRGMETFGVLTVGGTSWKNSAGTGVIGQPQTVLVNTTVALAKDQGIRIANLAMSLIKAPPGLGPGDIAPPNAHVTALLDSVTTSLGKALWTDETRLHCTCEAYCRGWTAAVGCGTCDGPAAFSFPGADHMCIHPGPSGTGLLCRMNQTTFKPTPVSCCGVGGPCQLPLPDVVDVKNSTSQWPGGCCWGGKCGNCAGGSPVSDTFPLLNDTRTSIENRRWFDYSTNKCMLGIK